MTISNAKKTSNLDKLIVLVIAIGLQALGLIFILLQVEEWKPGLIVLTVILAMCFSFTIHTTVTIHKETFEE